MEKLGRRTFLAIAGAAVAAPELVAEAPVLGTADVLRDVAMRMGYVVPDATFIAWRKICEEEICTAYAVPVEMIRMSPQA